MRAQPVFEDVSQDARFYLADFQRFAAGESAQITFKIGTELYHLDAFQLSLSYMAADSAPVDPLVAFKDVDGFPYIRRGDLKEMPGGVPGGETPFFRVERMKGGAVGQLALYSWPGLAAEILRATGRDASTEPDTTLRGLLEYRGGVPPEYLLVAERSQGEAETFGQALIRLDFAKPRDLLFAALGGSRLFNPTCHMANAIGRTLLTAGKIKAHDLKAALAEQVETGKGLAYTLHRRGACAGPDIASGLEELKGETIFLPPSDKMEEMLVKTGKISRTDLMSAVFKIQGTGTTLARYLVDEELVSGADIAAAQAWHDLKMRLRTAGKVRIGQLLLEDGTLTKDRLKEALLIQAERPDPLGEILMLEGLCSPEAVIRALLEQELRLNELVAAATLGGDSRSIEDLPLFDVPFEKLKGRKKPAKDAYDDQAEAEPAGAGKPGKGKGEGGSRAKGAVEPKGKGKAQPAKGKAKPAKGKAKGTGKTEPKAARGTGKLDPAKARGTGKLDPADAAAKSKGKRAGKGKRKVADDAPRKAVQWKPIVGAVVVVAVFGVLAFGTITLVNALSRPGAPPAPKIAASPAPAKDAAKTAFGGAAALQDQLFSTDSAEASAAMDVAAMPAAAPPAAAPGAAVPPAAGPPGSLRQQAAAGSTIVGDKTSMSHLSNEELRNIAKKNPMFMTADDVEAKGGRVGEVIQKLEKTDPQMAKAVAAARMTSGANILNQELDNLENDAPGQLEVRDAGGPGGAPGAQAQAGAAASFRSAQGEAAPAAGQAPEQSGQFSRAAAGDMAPAAIQDTRRQLGAFAGQAPGAQGGQAPGAPAGQAPGAPGGQAPGAPGGQAPGAPGAAGARAPGVAPQAGPAAGQQGIFDERQLQAQLKKNPKDVGAANGMGLALLQKGQPAQAEKVLRRAQASRPQDPVLNQNLAAALMAQKKDAAAVPLLKKSQASYKTQTDAHLKQAQVAFAKKDLKTAEVKIRLALRSQTMAANTSARLGTALQRLGKTAEAKVYLRRAAETYFAVSRVHVQLGQVYAGRGNHKMAIFEYKTASKLDPRAGRPWYLLGKEAAALKKVAQATRFYKTALAKEPKAPWAKEVRKALAP